jgi:hypothetical protein
MKPGPFHKLKSIKRALIRADITKNQEHVYLKFLTPLAPSVEKTVNLQGFKYIYKPRNINILFSQCG